MKNDKDDELKCLLKFFLDNFINKKKKFSLEKNKVKDRIIILNRHVTWNIEGENQTDINNETNKFISREDYRLFKGCIRFTLIDVNLIN